MGALRAQFWELPLDTLTRAEWEALCDGCGQCCLHKLEDADTGEVLHTNVACKLLDLETAQCSNYRNRRAFVPDCLRLTARLLPEIRWLPDTCAYVRRAKDLPLPQWHYLLTGDRDDVRRAGVSVAGRVITEDEAGPLEHHIVEPSFGNAGASTGTKARRA
ncbi:MAG: YcgN family cysteine cluster protein [Novosphingobium sp.]